jgi:hypothetical protein
MPFFIKGLLPELRAVVKAHEPADLPTAINKAKKYESGLYRAKGKKKKSKKYQDSSDDDSSDDESSEDEEPVRKRKTSSKNKKKKSRKQ